MLMTFGTPVVISKGYNDTPHSSIRKITILYDSESDTKCTILVRKTTRAGLTSL